MQPSLSKKRKRSKKSRRRPRRRKMMILPPGDFSFFTKSQQEVDDDDYYYYEEAGKEKRLQKRCICWSNSMSTSFSWDLSQGTLGRRRRWCRIERHTQEKKQEVKTKGDLWLDESSSAGTWAGTTAGTTPSWLSWSQDVNRYAVCVTHNPNEASSSWDDEEDLGNEDR